MKILVIGAKGFIGSYMSKILSSKFGHDVYQCDVVAEYGNANYFIIDATDSDFHKVFSKQAFDICINCSGAASVPDSLINPLRDFTLNTLNVVKIMDAIRSIQPACKLINLSSAAVYGNPVSLPIAESTVAKPISPYGLHKKQAEEICTLYHETYQLSVCSARIFSAYGNGLRKQLFWDTYQKAQKSDSLILYGTGLETRDFIHVSDVVRAIECCIRNASFEGDVINIANGSDIKIRNAVETLLSFSKTSKTVSFNQQVKEGDPLFWKADITKLSSMGYTPSVSLHDGLKDYFEWIQKI